MSFDFDRVPDRRGTRSLKWSRYGADVLPLWVADMDFPAPPPVLERLRGAVDHGVFGYELPSTALAQTVVHRMKRLYDWVIPVESVLATPGIVAGFKAAARAVCEPGQGVLIQPPVYHPFLETPPHTHTTLQQAPLRVLHGKHTLRYEVDWAGFESALNTNGTRTGMLLLCHPHNPTGQVWTRSDLARLGEICLRNGTVICSDEIHSELLLGGASHTPLATVSPELAENSITLVSPSKTFNVVGLFCGFAIIPNPSLRKRYRRVLQHLALHVNSLGLMAAEVAMSGECDGWLMELRKYLTANRNYVVDFVARELPGVRVTVPDATYLAWMDFGEWVRAGKLKPNPFTYLLEEAKVALNPGTEFGQGGEACVRLNFGCPRSTLVEALARMKTALERAA